MSDTYMPDIPVWTGPATRNLPRMVECLGSGALDAIPYRLKLWDRVRLLELRAEVPLFYAEANEGLRQAANELGRFGPKVVEGVQRASQEKLQLFCSYLEASVDLILRQREEEEKR